MNLKAMIETGVANPLLLFAAALLLGGLHGLEPGHSKTMIAAYIVAIRGSVWQAALLGISAAISHSIIVWVLAILALTYGNSLIGHELEPWFMMASGVIVLGIAVWMLVQAFQTGAINAGTPHGHEHHDQRHGDHDHHHAHDHHAHDHVHDHAHDHHHHGHGHSPGHTHLDAHAQAHAQEIERHMNAGQTSTWQTILFGLSGGLIPCPAAITVFLLCLQLGQLTLGITLVSAFSIGLAATLVLVGAVAALGLNAIRRHTSRFDRLLDAAPYLSALLIAAIGCLMIWFSLGHFAHAHG
jgi:nickel/cobalt transporter (NicO) family protein